MFLKKILCTLFGIFLLQSCSTTKSTIFWVSGVKTTCSVGVGNKRCLKVYKGKDLDNATWEIFYSDIDNFNFEEGYLKKIVVKPEKLNPNQVPTDASFIKYTLVKELEKKPDYHYLLSNKWILNKINDQPINKMIVLPTLQINLTQMIVSGTNGCNNYTCEIEEITPNTIKLKPIATQEKMCFNKNLENEYNNVLSFINEYKIINSNLLFYDKNKKSILSFIKQNTLSGEANKNLHDIWNVVQINGNLVDRTSPIPSLEINLTKMNIMGSDGCNNYYGSITTVDDTRLVFGAVASTRKACPSMNTANEFNTAMSNVVAYRLTGLKLVCIDSDGNEIITLLKTD